uniref:Uncharacterized protein n=1 Tax=Triticum urartu TaxID=4572 RepID=A0A8R7R4W2_TRIUA
MVALHRGQRPTSSGRGPFQDSLSYLKNVNPDLINSLSIGTQQISHIVFMKKKRRHIHEGNTDI